MNSASLAMANGKELHCFNPASARESLRDLVYRQTQGRGADDVVVCVPSASVMAEAAMLMAPDGMLVLFAGVPNGTLAPLDMGRVYLHNAQYTGTSGSTLSDQALVLQKTQVRKLSPARSVAAIGGIEAAADGLRAMIAGRFAGKIVIFPQLTGLPLTGLAELEDKHPEIAEALGPGGVWTDEAERRLIERFWTG
jgi:threonine dehydrogenase-like Zn-dependent dehydrogenase